MSIGWTWDEGPYLEHYGIPGMKWGVRRYQNKDGSLTAAGKRHEQKTRYKSIKKIYKQTKAAHRLVGDTEAYEKALEHIPKESLNRVLPYDKAYDQAASRSARYRDQIQKQYAKTGRQANKKQVAKMMDLSKKDWEALSNWDKASNAEVDQLLGKYGNRRMRRS